MTAVTQLAPLPIFRALSATGQPLAGGKLYTYAAGTTTPLATYTDSTGGTPNTNPVVLDSTGSANVWLNFAAYKFVLKDSSGNIQFTIDQINAQPPQTVNVLNYGAVGDGTTDDSQAFTDASAAAGSWGTVIVPRPTTSYKLGSNVTNNAFWILMGGATTSGTGTLAGLVIQQVSGGTISLGGTSVYIDSTGKVGIGTASPSKLLEVDGDVLVDDTLTVGATTFDDGITTGGDFTVDSDSNINFITTFGSYSWSSGYATYSWSGASNSNLTFSSSGIVAKNSTNIYFEAVPTGAPDATGYIATNPVANPFSNWSSSLANTSQSGICTEGQMEVSNGATGSSRYAFCQYVNTSTHALTFAWNQANARNVYATLAQTGAWNFGIVNSFNNSIQINGDTSSSTGNLLTLYEQASGSTSYKTCLIKRGGSEVGSISTTNSATAYNTSSDYRLKENCFPIVDALEIVEQTPMYRGNFVGSEDKVTFGLAHEMQKFIPNAVTGEKDGEEMQQADYSKLVPILWAAVQELSKQLEELKHGRQ